MPAGAVVQLEEDEAVCSAEEVLATLHKVGLGEEPWMREDFVGGRGGLRTACCIGTFSALGGFLFGLDMGYISGVESMKSLCDDLLGGRPMDAMTMGIATGIFALGAVVAALPPLINAIVNRLGRAGCVVLGGAAFCVGAGAQSLSPNLALLFVGRFVAGGAVGMLSANIPVYQGEIAPKEVRGMIITLYQLAITVGIMVAFWINYALQSGDDGWRYSIGLQLLPGVALLVGGLFMPESPRWLVQRGRHLDAFNTLLRIRGPGDDVRRELARICQLHEHEMADGGPTWRGFFSGMNVRLLAIGVLLQLLQQMSGVNVFIYYGPIVFQRVFQSHSASFLFSAIAGVVNFASTIPAIFLADRVGRTQLLRMSALGMAVCCASLALVGSVCFVQDGDGGCHQLQEGQCGYTPDAPPCDFAPQAPRCGDWAKWVATGSIFLFLFNFAYGWGPVVWIYVAEIYPLRYRTMVTGMTTGANWVGNFCIGFFPPVMISRLGFSSFWLLMGVNLIGLALVLRLPETKGRSLEDVQTMFEHWLGYEAGGEKRKKAPESST